MYAALPPCALLLALLSGAASTDVALDDARRAYVEARTFRDGLEERRQLYTAALDEESSRIEALKARAEGKLIRPVGLDAALRRSQGLSARLNDLAKERAGAEASVEARRQALLTALAVHNDALLTRWDRADRNERRLILDSLRAVRAERDQLRGTAGRPTATALRGSAAAHSDDPAELLAQADALRDAEDKVRRRLAELDRRRVELRSERDLDRRMNEFLGDEALLDEQDRRFGGASPVAARAGDPPGEASSPSLPVLGNPGPGSSGSSPSVSRGRVDDGRPAVGAPSPLSPEALRGVGDELEQITRELSTLAAQADAFGREADAAEARARASP